MSQPLAITFVYRNGKAKTVSAFPALNVKETSCKNLDEVLFGDYTVNLRHDEESIAHRLRRQLKIGEEKTRDCYVLMTTRRKIFFFSDGRFVAMPEGGEVDAYFRAIAITPEEFEYAKLVMKKGEE